MSLENERPRLEHTKTIELKRGCWMRRNELKNLFVLVRGWIGEGGYITMLLTTPTRTIHQEMTFEEIDAYLDELTKDEKVVLFELRASGLQRPVCNYVRLVLSFACPTIEVSGADRASVFGTAETLHHHLQTWPRRFINLSRLSDFPPLWLVYVGGLAVFVIPVLLSQFVLLDLGHTTLTSMAIYLVIVGPPLLLQLVLSRYRRDLTRAIRFDFYKPKDEEREEAQKWAERKEKLVWLAIGVVFTVVAELVGYWVLKKLGWL